MLIGLLWWFSGGCIKQQDHEPKMDLSKETCSLDRAKGTLNYCHIFPFRIYNKIEIFSLQLIIKLCYNLTWTQVSLFL